MIFVEIDAHTHRGLEGPVEVLVVGLSGSSCIIPDHGIVGSVSCGARWCATAEYAQALGESNNIVQVQETQPDGTTGWVTACVCMTPSTSCCAPGGDRQLAQEAEELTVLVRRDGSTHERRFVRRR